MAKVTPVLRADTADSDGRRALRLRFTDTHRTLYAKLDVRLRPSEWNARKGEVRKGHARADEINGLLAQRLADVEAERLRLLTVREPVTAEALRAVVAISPTAAPTTPTCFLAFGRRFVETLERQGNVGRFKREGTVFAKLEAFVRAARLGPPLPFSRLTPQFLRDYEAHLIGTLGNKPATAQGNLKVLHTHFRRAVREGVAGDVRDPWDAFTPARAAKPERPKLTAEQIIALEALDLGAPGPSASLDARVRDAFLVALYAAGMRFGDVARLQRRHVVGNDADGYRLVYEMGKTGKRADVRLITRAARLIGAYLKRRKPSPDDFVFGFLNGYRLDTPKRRWDAIGSQNALANKTLKKLARLASTDAVELPAGLSFHIARHSFADLARRSGWSTYDVSKALAHSSLAQTERYLAGFDAAGLDARLDALFHDDQ